MEKERDLSSQQGIKGLENSWYFFSDLFKPRGLRLEINEEYNSLVLKAVGYE